MLENCTVTFQFCWFHYQTITGNNVVRECRQNWQVHRKTRFSTSRSYSNTGNGNRWWVLDWLYKVQWELVAV